jgi:hypothetical protein
MCYPIVGFVDRYIFTLEYYGAMNVFDTDGLFVTRLFDDLAPEYQNTGECLGGAAFKHPNGNVYASIAPDCTYRISRIRVDGLDKTERFSGKLILAKPPSRPRNIEPEQRVWKILRRRDDVAIDGEINAREWNTDTDRQAPEYFLYNDARVATAWAQWDKDALYLACRIADATPALNRRTGADRLMSDQVEVVFRGPLGTNNPIMDCALAIGNDAAGKPSAFALAGAAKGQELPGSKAALVVQPGAGYALEARLPWAALSSYRPVPGDRLGWSVRIGWGAADGETLDHKCMWRFDYRPGSRNDIGAAMLGE